MVRFTLTLFIIATPDILFIPVNLALFFLVLAFLMDVLFCSYHNLA